jgi:16S rRNA (cytosine967-C5)-methyltransferase
VKAREAALNALMRIETETAYTNLALQQSLRKASLDARDRALTTELVYGTVQRQRTLDALLAPLSKRKLQDLEPSVRVLLRMSVYQLAFLDKVPTYAVLNEAVSLCKQALPRASGFVNAVLRSFVRDGRPWQQQLGLPEGLPSAADLGLAYSFPTWIVRQLVTAYGRARAEKILRASNQPASLSVRVNRLRTRPNDVLHAIQAAYGDVARASELYAYGIRFDRGIDVEGWEEYTAGRVTVQDEGAMLIAPLLAPLPGERVLDLCAAPGAKTAHLAELMQDSGAVIGCDLHAHKVKLIRQAARRLGLTCVQTATADARLLPGLPGYEQGFDKVLLDAPCSGLGVLRHRPDIRWKRTPEDVAQLSQLQRELLQTALRLVKPGGVIVYSTCTLLPQENGDVIEEATALSNRHIQIEEPLDGLPEHLLEATAGHGPGLCLTPELFDTDGFYMIRLRVN